jgi:hypothetical protein
MYRWANTDLRKTKQAALRVRLLEADTLSKELQRARKDHDL